MSFKYFNNAVTYHKKQTRVSLLLLIPIIFPFLLTGCDSNPCIGIFKSDKDGSEVTIQIAGGSIIDTVLGTRNYEITLSRSGETLHGRGPDTYSILIDNGEIAVDGDKMTLSIKGEEPESFTHE
jgi:hypothetical protein